MTYGPTADLIIVISTLGSLGLGGLSCIVIGYLRGEWY